MTEAKNCNVEVAIDEELKNSYLTYGMSVIVSRALPDVRDGLKPSQRRILVAMNDLQLHPKSKHRKCAKIAGDTSGNYHPHGETIVYPTLVRMAQPFNMRCPLIDGQGNFGSLDGDPPAAMRYTEARMTSVAIAMLEDLDKSTVEFVSNYDETRQEPVVLPSKFPNLLVNGSVGIAVGMATFIPPNNLGEVCAGILAVLDNPEITLQELCQIIPGPDFPTGGIICGIEDAQNAYCSGRGKITMRSKVNVEEVNNKSYLVFSEIPYQVNKADILESIASLVKDGKISGISDIRDESDREHPVRIVIELKKGEISDVILNQLYKYTSLQSSFSIGMIALVDAHPITLNIKEMIIHFIQHRRIVIRRRTEYLLKKSRDRHHIVSGLVKAVNDIDAIIGCIRQSDSAAHAKEHLMNKFDLTDVQTDAILQTKLRTLTTLEYDALRQDETRLENEIVGYEKTLGDPKEIDSIIRSETNEIRTKHTTPRITQIGEIAQDLAREAITRNEPTLIFITNRGYIKRMSLSFYRNQNRGGKGISGGDIAEDDSIKKLFFAMVHDTLLFFTNFGKVYAEKAYNIPDLSRISKGRALINCLSLQQDEQITSIINIDKFDDRYLMMVTQKGMIKKTKLTLFARRPKKGIQAIILGENDLLVAAAITDGKQEILLGTSHGRAMRFDENYVRVLSRTARGVRACKLLENDTVMGMVAINPDEQIMTIFINGMARKTDYLLYRKTKRGSLGVINVKSKKMAQLGSPITIISIQDTDEIMAITAQGFVIRTRADAFRSMSRTGQGVKMISFKGKDDYVVSVARIPAIFCNLFQDEIPESSAAITQNTTLFPDSTQQNTMDTVCTVNAADLDEDSKKSPPHDVNEDTQPHHDVDKQNPQQSDDSQQHSDAKTQAHEEQRPNDTNKQNPETQAHEE